MGVEDDVVEHDVVVEMVEEDVVVEMAEEDVVVEMAEEDVVVEMAEEDVVVVIEPATQPARCAEQKAWLAFGAVRQASSWVSQNESQAAR
jgi:hypothetical protein